GKKPEFEGRKPQSEVHVSPSSSAQTKKHDDKTKREAKGKSPVESSIRYRNLSAEFEDFSDNSINEVNAADSPVSAVGQISTNSTNTFSVASPSNTVVSPTHGKYSYVNTSQYPDDPNMPELEDITYSDDEEDAGAEADFTNLETNITVNLIPITKVHKDHPVTQIIGDLSSATQTMKEPKRVHQALKDPSWIEAMQNELLQFKMQKDEGIDYEEVFAPVARIEAIRLFLAYASFMGFMVYQMDVKSAFLYGTIGEEVYVCQPPGFEEPDYPDKERKEWGLSPKAKVRVLHTVQLDVTKMDDPNITIEEYIQLEAEKARKRRQDFNWEIATYGKVKYFKDIDYFKDFENEFPAIVYKDALTSKLEVSYEPTVSAHHIKKVDFDFVVSFDESDDEDYTVSYDKNSFSYKLVSVNDLKSDCDNDDYKIDIKQSSGDISVKPLPDDLIGTKEEIGGVLIFWNLMCVVVMLVSRSAFTTHNLAHKLNMENPTEQIPWKFLVLIL
nr:hypothetical protein [Tanacetum cinerariifolium]